jgi:hypothetical protein
MLFHLAALWGAFCAFSAVFYADDPAARRHREDRRVEAKKEGAEPLAPMDG